MILAKHFPFYLLCSLIFLIQFSAAENYVVRLKKIPSIGIALADRLLGEGDEFSTLDFLGSQMTKTFSFGSFQGFSGNFTSESIKKLKQHPLIADIVPDMIFDALDGESTESTCDGLNPPQSTCPIGVFSVNNFENGHSDGHLDLPRPNPVDGDGYGKVVTEPQLETNGFTVQQQAPRHLARISRKLKLPEHDKEPFNYYYDPKNRAEGVHVYVLDTGIVKDHPEFEGRVIDGGDFTGRGFESDPHGHGTHVAGIIGSKTFGVAKGVTLVEVKSLDYFGNGSLTSVLSGVDFAVKHMKEHNVIGVANLSLGSGKNKLLDDAVESAVESGLVVVVAAGNNNNPACQNSPANSPFAISVGAIDDRTDHLAQFSSYGPCVDIFASGVDVASLGLTPEADGFKSSGTSMAAPAVTGMVAILLSQGVSPHDVPKKLLDMSTEGQIPKKTLFFKQGTPNKILNNGFAGNDDQFLMNSDPSDYNKRAYLEVY